MNGLDRRWNQCKKRIMKVDNIYVPEVFFTNNCLTGENVVKSTRLLGDLDGVFQDKDAFEQMDRDQIIYQVSSFLPVVENTPGGLFMGITLLYPGKVGQEFFMTKGHFHTNSNRAEFYWGVEGEGMLILMDEQRNVWAERMFPGSLHYIPGKVAHRVANIGYQKLVFSACWPSDAGHDYATIEAEGFARSLMDVNGVPTLL